MSVLVVKVYCSECKHEAPDEAVTSDDVMIPVASCLRCRCLRFERIYGEND